MYFFQYLFFGMCFYLVWDVEWDRILVPIIWQGIPGHHLPFFYPLTFFVSLCPTILGFSFCALRK
jgi:hypothetical protein